MSNVTEKKPRTAKQAAANQEQRNEIKLFETAGIKRLPLAVKYYKEQKKTGRNMGELIESMKVKFPVKNANGKKIVTKRAPAAAPAAAAAAAANEAPKNTTKKVRTEKQLAANQKTRNITKILHNAGIKQLPLAVKYYSDQVKAGRDMGELIKSLQVKFPLVNANGKKIVTKRAPKKNAAAPAAPAAPAANGVKGSYVCEKCTYMPKNNNSSSRNTRKNKNNARYENNQGYKIKIE